MGKNRNEKIDTGRKITDFEKRIRVVHLWFYHYSPAYLTLIIIQPNINRNHYKEQYNTGRH